MVIKSLFAELDGFVTALSPVYGERGVNILMRAVDLHKETEHYRQAVRRKPGAYHCFLQMGVIAQGLLQMLAILYPDTVWRCLGSWVRTIRPGGTPSEQVVTLAPSLCGNVCRNLSQVSAKPIRWRKSFQNTAVPQNGLTWSE